MTAPLNPKAPDRVPGGSSSGSASAVAGVACNVALSTDSGGSVRVPASFSGLYGMPPPRRRTGRQHTHSALAPPIAALMLALTVAAEGRRFETGVAFSRLSTPALSAVKAPPNVTR
jgi:Asp-tRNA(Asn)/Glu-tRNA(Gln) amidotransferase A subunit family amidase